MSRDQQMLDVAERRARAFEMHVKGVAHSTIASTLGYIGPDAVRRDVSVTLKLLTEHQYSDMEEVRAAELARLDRVLERAMEVLETRHAVLYQGENTGYVDDAPTLAAGALILKIMDRRSKLLGLDAPTKIGISGAVRYELVGIDPERLT